MPYIIFRTFDLQFIFAPIVSFHLYFLECLSKIESWMNLIKVKLTKETNQNFILDECNELMSGLQLLTDAISSIIFWLITSILLLSIVEAYIMIVYILSPTEFNQATTFLMVGYGFFGIFFLYFLYSYCTFSQFIKDSSDQIKLILLNNPEKDENKIQKTQALLKFETWNGFHGNGYFTLGKSLLTAVVANFITYLIILIQFKVSEL